MGEQRNLTEENVTDLRKHLEKMKEGNPELTYRFFKQDQVNPQQIIEAAKVLCEKFISGMTRSDETHADCKTLLAMITLWENS